MRKKFVKVMFFGALALSTVTYVGCQDYDDDIDKLQTQIDANKADIAKLQALLNEGNWVTEVKGIENGFSITFNNGQSYEIVNGEKGATGTAGSKVTIDEETGEWLIDGAGTGWFANVEDGKSPYIADGTNGDKGYWYFWDEEAGEFVKGDKAQGEPGQSVTGPSGKSPYIDADGFWQYYDDAQSKWVKGPKAAGTNGTNGNPGKDAFNPFIGDDGYWYYWDVNADNGEGGKGKVVKGEYAGTGTWVVKEQNRPAYRLHINELQADGTYKEIDNIILPVADAISSIDAVYYDEASNSIYPGISNPMLLYYGIINDKVVEFHGKKYGEKGKKTTLVGTVGANLYAVINPVDVDFSEYSVKLINSFGEEKFNLKQEKLKSDKPLTRAEKENVGVYKFTVTPTTNITDDMHDQYIAYALKTTDAFGNEIISKYDAKVKVLKHSEYIAVTNKEVEFTKDAKLDELFADQLAKVVDRFYIVNENDLKAIGATFDRETSTITAPTKQGTVNIKIEYLMTNGTIVEGNAAPTAQIHFQYKAGQDLSIAPVSYTLKHGERSGYATAEITADNNPTLFALLNKDFDNGKPTVEMGSVKFAAGDKITVDGKEYPYWDGSIWLVDLTSETKDNKVTYYIKFGFDAAKVAATEHNVVINVINPDENSDLNDRVLEEVSVKVTVNDPGVFEFKPLSAYFSGNSAVTYANFDLSSYTTITEDLYNLFEAIPNEDKAFIRFNEECPNFGTADNPELGDAWLDAPNTQNSVITVPQMKAEKNAGVYSTRKLTVTYQPFGNERLAKINKSFDLTVKSSIYEAVSKGKAEAPKAQVLALDARSFKLKPTDFKITDMSGNSVDITADPNGKVKAVSLRLDGDIKKYAYINTEGTTEIEFNSEATIALNADFMVVQTQMTGYATLVVKDAWGATSEVKCQITLKNSKNDK